MLVKENTSGAYGAGEKARHRVRVTTHDAQDAQRGRTFCCDVWAPDDEHGPFPLIVFSHSTGGGRRQSTFLCEHLASHGYVVAALDHSETFAPELARSRVRPVKRRRRGSMGGSRTAFRI
ncbi:MAG: hypothetical protein NVS9B15_20210 [Acidobacteriaceae bacterium]